MQSTIVAATAAWPAGTKVHFVWASYQGGGMSGTIERWLTDGFVLSHEEAGELTSVVVPWRSVLYMRGAR